MNNILLKDFSFLPWNIRSIISDLHSEKEQKIILNWFKKINYPISFRVNTILATNKEIEDFLKKNNYNYKKVDFLQNWYLVFDTNSSNFFKTDLVSYWKIYLQWIASQLVWEIFSKIIVSNNTKVLDLARAPWWKTSHIWAILQNNWEIIAIEPNKIRFDKLNYTLKKQKITNSKTLKIKWQEIKNNFEKEYFDVIIADLPCSASGRINLQKEKSYFYFHKDNIDKKNYKLQKDILKNNISLLKKWWYIIYSTCSISPLENEWILHFLLSNYPELKMFDLWDFLKDQNFYKEPILNYKNNFYNKEIKKRIRILPSSITEWFFIWVLKKV